jgi:RNA polymerase sigma-70 factor (ECF subfamily)
MTEALLPKIAAGDTSAIEEFVKRYEKVIWWMARQYCSHDPEDAVQDVFLALWQAAAKFDESKAQESTFVGMLARRKLIDRYRRTKRRPVTQDLETAPEHLFSQAPTLEAEAEAALATRLMRRELRPEQRSVIELSVFEGLSHREISTWTGIPLGTVKTHIRRGLQHLREIMVQPQRVAA